MKIVADENIPLVDYYFGSLGELVLKPGRAIVRDDLVDADILLVRSVTAVNQALLQETAITFVGSTTTGADHMDTDWLTQAGVQWSVAAGCNGAAVVEYVIAVVAALQKKNVLVGQRLRAGVIGVGAIGRIVAEKLSLLGFDVILCDPFRAEHEADFSGVSIDALADLDFITLHTPMTYAGAYPTHHLIEKHFLQRQKPGCVLLNTGRGSVIDFADLKKYGEDLIWCLDVWENEPHIDLAVLQKAMIATPHIAGYSMQSKYRGIDMIYHAALRQGVIQDLGILPIHYPRTHLSFAGRSADWRDVVLEMYNPAQTTQHMKQILDNNKNAFDALRKNFPERHEFRYVDISDVVMSQYDNELLQKLMV